MRLHRTWHFNERGDRKHYVREILCLDGEEPCGVKTYRGYPGNVLNNLGMDVCAPDLRRWNRVLAEYYRGAHAIP